MIVDLAFNNVLVYIYLVSIKYNISFLGKLFLGGLNPVSATKQSIKKFKKKNLFDI